MMRTKKELLEIVLVFVLGVIGLLILGLNINNYNKQFSNTISQTINK